MDSLETFLILKNLKYLMSWMGKWGIRLYFSTQYLIYLPIKYSVANSVVDITNTIANLTATGDASLTKNFTQIGMAAKWYLASGTSTTAGGLNTLNATKMTLNNVEMNTAQFQIRMDIMEMLKQKYMSEKPLTFPVSTIQIARFTGATSYSSTDNDTALSIVLCKVITTRN